MAYIMALDQGTTSSRALIIEKNGNIKAMAQEEFTQIFPHEQWVEHDPETIWTCQKDMMEKVLRDEKIPLSEMAAIGITNQRETTVVWDKNTGEPVYNAIVWQCRRTSDLCYELSNEGKASIFKEKTGLPLDAYFSGTKIRWILDNVEGARERAEGGDLLFGTIDTWLIWKLTAGKVHVTDMTNACRTLLFNIHTQKWDQELLDILKIPASLLPEVKSCSEIYGYTDKNLLGAEVPISGIAGDQQAALFGQMCLKKGEVKNTYGTGCFLLMNTGEEPIPSTKGLLTTIALNINGKTTYALEGSVFMGGAVIQWLRDNLGIIDNARQCDELAEQTENNGVYLVSAFQGLGAPYWGMEARASISGLTRGSDKRQICRAALESIAFRTRDVIDVMAEESGIPLNCIRVDGGASRSNILMEIQSNISNTMVIRPKSIETTALGAAYLAGLAVGFWKSMDEISNIWQEDRIFTPSMDSDERESLYEGWKIAVKKCLM
ncbi:MULTISPECIES: glycerol kinase GlpK [unclassified Oceanispirochaeta]|uniref:glycerol kinase GlpK n=1 Tax=unclassified Oceanispirochaeta TaxID=2635722 RepID=UPI000E0961B3|nr:MULTISPECIES: glycerol kinase GlpK [unclassified Oceanispirochaeta]MBF9018420.1 glycerol kinase GlpK [Oceanispirochaeta sp. M2]NPD74851.1 glycerol kinase GlpK [Oceanispirochaeta sp. M1]RDG29293.1 glycerol kinase [Oceanispirochaeta sp. M1]